MVFKGSKVMFWDSKRTNVINKTLKLRQPKFVISSLSQVAAKKLKLHLENLLPNLDHGNKLLKKILIDGTRQQRMQMDQLSLLRNPRKISQVLKNLFANYRTYVKDMLLKKTWRSSHSLIRTYLIKLMDSLTRKMP